MSRFPRAHGSDPVMLSPGTYNRLMDEVEGARRLSVGDVAGGSQTGDILCRWMGPGAIDLGAPVALVEGSHPNDDTDLGAFLGGSLVNVAAVTRAYNMGRWGVAMGSAKQGDDIIPVRVWGPVYCTIDYPSTRAAAKYADISAGGSIQLDVAGWARVLWKEATASTQSKALLLLGSAAYSWFGTTTGVVAAGSTPSLQTEYGFTRTAKHDKFPGDIPADTKVWCHWDAIDAEFHIVVIGCP